MQIFNATNVWTYLPNDKAPVPFGDPIPVTSISIAAPGVVTVPGEYVPANGDAVSLSVAAGGALPTGLSVGVTYFVVGAAGETFNLSATKGGGAITTTGSTSGAITLHLLSNEVDGVTLPFKPGYTVVVLNLTGGSLVLQGAPDLNTTTFGQPQGPGTPVTLATVAAGSAQIVQLSTDWIRVSTAATLVLMQS